MRILLLTQWFDPEPTSRGLTFARELVRLNHQVEVVTGFPNYPGGSVYEGYKILLIQREFIDGVHITRLPLFPSHDNNVFGRAANYLSFAISAGLYCIFALKRVDVIYAYHPPLTVGIIAAIVKFFRRVPMVCDIQDIWPDTLRATGMIRGRITLATISFICKWMYGRADRIVVLSEGFRNMLIDRGVAGSKIQVIANWCDEAALLSCQKSVAPTFFDKTKFNVLFAGNMGRAQSLNSVLRAAELLQHSTKAVFLFLGVGIELEALKVQAKSRSLSNVHFLPAVPMKEVGAYLNAADALLVHLKDDPLFAITIPSKTQIYMASGKPIVMAVKGDAARLVESARCGELAMPQDPHSIARAIRILAAKSPDELELLGANGRNFYYCNLSLSVGVNKFLDAFHYATKIVPLR